MFWENIVFSQNVSIRFKASRSFLKKRTKKLLSVGPTVDPPRAQICKSFCFFFQKEALSLLLRAHRIYLVSGVTL